MLSYIHTHVLTLDRDQRVVVRVLTNGLEPIQKDNVRPLFIFIVYWRLEVTRCPPLSSSVCLSPARTHVLRENVRPAMQRPHGTQPPPLGPDGLDQPGFECMGICISDGGLIDVVGRSLKEIKLTQPPPRTSEYDMKEKKRQK